MGRKQSVLALAIALAVLALSSPAVSTYGQDDEDETSGETMEPATSSPVAQPVSPLPSPVTVGGCDTTGLSLSRPWITRSGQLDWWAWGFAFGSNVGLQLVDPTGKSTAVGSLVVDSLCEASGTVTVDNRVPGMYTLVISGTRAGGEALQLTASFHIVTTSRPSGAGTSIQPPPPPAPVPTVPCQATATVLCP